MVVNAILMALMVLFINAAFWDGNIIDKIIIKRRSYTISSMMPYDDSLKNYIGKLPEWIRMPLYGCVICMTPWYSVGIGLPLFYGSWHIGPDQIIFILASSGVSVLIDTFVISQRDDI